MASFGKIRWISRSFTTLSSAPLRVCVVGSGPAGFYTAEKILKAHEGVEVDIIDRLPTPFGLVRSGVAPDHPETKLFRKIAIDSDQPVFSVALNERCSFFGNVSFGSSVTLPEVHELYSAVVLAYGAESDRSLGIPGEDLAGIYAAREFVWWYNGHLDGRNLDPDLKSTDTAVILGQESLFGRKTWTGTSGLDCQRTTRSSWNKGFAYSYPTSLSSYNTS